MEYEQEEQLSFESISFSVDGLEEWVGMSGISVQHEKDFLGASVKFTPPESLTYSLKDGMELNICFGYTLPTIKPNPINFSILQNTYFKLTSKNPLPLNDFIFIVHKIVTLLNFAMDSTVSIKNVFCFFSTIMREVNGKIRPEPIQLFYESEPFSEIKPKTDWHTMLFRFVDIKDRFNEVVDKWLDAYETISPSLNLYFSNKIGAHTYLDGQFLTLAQALETYHRITSNDTLMPKKSFNTLIKQIKSHCPEEYKEWLSQRLDYGNELSLRTRLHRIIESCKSTIGTSEEVELIVKNIVDTRNYFTHYDLRLENKAASGQNLWNLCQKMEAIFQLHLLKELCFDEVEINAVLNNTYSFRNKLQNTAISA